MKDFSIAKETLTAAIDEGVILKAGEASRRATLRRRNKLLRNIALGVGIALALALAAVTAARAEYRGSGSYSNGTGRAGGGDYAHTNDSCGSECGNAVQYIGDGRNGPAYSGSGGTAYASGQAARAGF